MATQEGSGGVKEAAAAAVTPAAPSNGATTKTAPATAAAPAAATAVAPPPGAASPGAEGVFHWPAAQALVPSLVAQNFAPGLSAPPAELLDVLEGQVQNAEVWASGSHGRKKRDDVFVELRSPVQLGQLGPWQAAMRERLAGSGDEAQRNRAGFVELVPGGVSLGAAAEPQEGVTVVDTDAVSMLFKGDTRSKTFEEQLKQQKRRLLCFQTVAELHAWILLRHFPEARIQKLEEMLAGFEVIWPDNFTCLLWAQLMDHGRAHGRPAGAQDAWVAAVALRHGASICTLNQKDYDYLPGIRFLATPAAASKSSTEHRGKGKTKAGGGGEGHGAHGEEVTAVESQREAPKEKKVRAAVLARRASAAAVEAEGVGNRALASAAAAGRRLLGEARWTLELYGVHLVVVASVAALAGGLFSATLARRERRT